MFTDNDNLKNTINNTYVRSEYDRVVYTTYAIFDHISLITNFTSNTNLTEHNHIIPNKDISELYKIAQNFILDKYLV